MRHQNDRSGAMPLQMSGRVVRVAARVHGLILQPQHGRRMGIGQHARGDRSLGGDAVLALTGRSPAESQRQAQAGGPPLTASQSFGRQRLQVEAAIGRAAIADAAPQDQHHRITATGPGLGFAQRDGWSGRPGVPPRQRVDKTLAAQEPGQEQADAGQPTAGPSPCGQQCQPDERQQQRRGRRQQQLFQLEVHRPHLRLALTSRLGRHAPLSSAPP